MQYCNNSNLLMSIGYDSNVTNMIQMGFHCPSPQGNRGAAPGSSGAEVGKALASVSRIFIYYIYKKTLSNCFIQHFV